MTTSGSGKTVGLGIRLLDGIIPLTLKGGKCVAYSLHLD